MVEHDAANSERYNPLLRFPVAVSDELELAAFEHRDFPGIGRNWLTAFGARIS